MPLHCLFEAVYVTRSPHKDSVHFIFSWLPRRTVGGRGVGIAAVHGAEGSPVWFIQNPSVVCHLFKVTAFQATVLMCPSVLMVLNSPPSPDGISGPQCCAVDQNLCWAEGQHLLLWATHGLGLVLIWGLHRGGVDPCCLLPKPAFGTRFTQLLSLLRSKCFWTCSFPGCSPRPAFVWSSRFFLFPFRRSWALWGFTSLGSSSGPC